MLMLGESILSLLIVTVVESWEYYQIYICGIVSTILLQYLHFASSPHDPDKHAMRRDSRAGLTFAILMIAYSISLIIVGTCFKMMLYEVVYKEQAKSAASSSSSTAHRALSSFVKRMLGGTSSASLRFSTEDRQQRIAHFFGGSLASVWFCMDMMTMVHIGWAEKKRKYTELPTTPLRLLFWICIALRIGLFVFFATLSQWVTKPSSLLC
jgi:hypothetical protein